MVVTMPAATAWRARSLLVQWVMCKPSATGSRQASLMIWARWRGGNLLRAAHAGFVPPERLGAALLVAPADPPDDGPVTRQAVGYCLDRLTAGNGQDDARLFGRKGGPVSVACHGL